MPMYVTRPRYCRDLPHRVTPPRQPLRHQVLSLRNYHIQNGQVYGIPQAIRAARIGGFDLMILTETNITDQAYFQNRMRYNMVLLQAIMTAGGEVQELMGLVIYGHLGAIVTCTLYGTLKRE